MTDYQRIYMDAYTKSSANAGGRGSVAEGIQTVAATAYRDGEAAGYRDGELAGLREGERAGIEMAAALFDEVQQDVADRIRAELAGTRASAVCETCNGTGVSAYYSRAEHRLSAGPCPDCPAGTEAAK